MQLKGNTIINFCCFTSTR